MIGFDYNALDKVDEARAHLGRLVKADPSDIDAVMALGNVLRVRKMFAEAADIYSKGIATLEKPDASHWQIFYNRGIAFERTKQWPKAEADFKKALELRPDQPMVLNYLGYSWVDQGMNYDEALAMIKKAVDLEPTDGYIVDSLGWVYFKLGRYDDAVRELEKAVDLKPRIPPSTTISATPTGRSGASSKPASSGTTPRPSSPSPRTSPRSRRRLRTVCRIRSSPPRRMRASRRRRRPASPRRPSPDAAGRDRGRRRRARPRQGQSRAPRRRPPGRRLPSPRHAGRLPGCRRRRDRPERRDVLAGPRRSGAATLAAEPSDDNLVVRAARLFMAVAGLPGGVAIRLEKTLPIASGLGGGSADAAAVLRALTRLTGHPLSGPVAARAVDLGADVPMCLGQQTARVTGIGEIVEPLQSALPPLGIVLVNPACPSRRPPSSARSRAARTRRSRRCRRAGPPPSSSPGSRQPATTSKRRRSPSNPRSPTSSPH